MKKTKNLETLNIVIVGHVDHGKSTLIGRLLHDTDSLPEGKHEELKKICEDRGTEVLEWSFVLDAFQAERDQAVTIDTTQIRFATEARNYTLIDAPGHKQFLKNMISGASQADAAILVVDAQEGMLEQTCMHANLLSLLGIRQILVVINKIDLIDYDQKKFKTLSKQVTDYLTSIGLKVPHIVPVSARNGDMIATRSDNFSWHKKGTLLEVLDSFDVGASYSRLPLRFPIQDVYRHDEKRILVGRVETGSLSVGDKLVFSPSDETATIQTIEGWPEPKKPIKKAEAGECIGLTIDKSIFVERGELASHTKSLPMLTNVFRANIFWLSSTPLKVGNTYRIRYGTTEASMNVQSIDRVFDNENVEREGAETEVCRNEIAEITLRTKNHLAVDSFADNPRLGRMVIYEKYDIAGGGSILTEGYPDQRTLGKPKSTNITAVKALINPDMRAKQFEHKSGIFWLTGLSGSGKSTLAIAVEQALYERTMHTYVLDGDNVRYGLNSDLGFSPEDRAENIRRIGEVANLLKDSGLIVITSFISPYREDRQRARALAPESFHEIYVDADLETCENRDPKGLYKKARTGKIKDFTGIGSPYEPPEAPELVINTKDNNVEVCVKQIVDYIMNVVKT